MPLPLIKRAQPQPHNSAKTPTPRWGGINTQPPTGSRSPGSTLGTSKGRPTAKASATPMAGSWITTPAGNGKREQERGYKPGWARHGWAARKCNA